ncbi:hypothetical protein HWV62_36223 [Athelia sp. TMB]|nr:hypothetical protein HWV62_36223 [Athelia sp. TMB]
MVPHGHLDMAKSSGEAWEYLLKDSKPGPLHAHPRGKQLVLACGQHATVISFALEAHIIGMKRSDFDDIISVSVPGSNKKKSHLQHSFVVPSRFHESTSSSATQRTVNIFIAWVSEDWVWALVDFSRLVRFYIISRNIEWTAGDLKPDSLVWPSLWTAFASGPDWHFETSDAIKHVKDWRKRTLAKSRISYKPIIKILCDADEPGFFAFGRHTANDFLHSTGIFPGAPAIFVCTSDARFKKFLCAIVQYMHTWAQPKFLNTVGGICNTHNPFAYNYKSAIFYRTHVMVFRKSYTYIPRLLYNTLLRAGLFNPKHCIGHAYKLTAGDKICTKLDRRVRVYYREGLDCFTVIRAKAPPKWKDGIEANDLQFAGYATTIGVAEFHELKVNRLNFELLLKNPALLVGSPGRKAKHLSTGFRGHPSKELTIRQKRKLVAMYAKAKRAAGMTVKPKKKRSRGGVANTKTLKDYFH